MVHHPVPTEPTRRDVADRRFLTGSERVRQRVHLRFHRRVETQGHIPTVSWRYVTSAVHETSTDRSVAPFATGIVVPISVAVAVLHCVASALGAGYWFDEVYMLAIGRNHLDWGSADQPPLAPALAGLMDLDRTGFADLLLAFAGCVATGCAVAVRRADRPRNRMRPSRTGFHRARTGDRAVDHAGRALADAVFA